MLLTETSCINMFSVFNYDY